MARLLAAAALALTGACAELPRYTALPVDERPSPNFDVRRPDFVILHHTSNRTAEEALETLTNPGRKVSAHYLITRTGEIVYLVDELARAWHAGESYWGAQHDINSASIGIELDNTGDEPFTQAQFTSLVALLADLKTRYGIPTENFLGHGDVAPGRKTDPSRWFPWRLLAAHGFGRWCDPPYPVVPAGMDDAMLLQAFGYNVWRLDAAVAAFRRHFAPLAEDGDLTEGERAMLYCLVLKRRALASPQEPPAPSE
jgi:N-acetylmuramoyl-L-alanine amidase